MHHNYWLAWKMKHGLASRGRVGMLQPIGWFAKVLYTMHFKRKQEALTNKSGPQIFYQEVGGSLGSTGKTNGE